MSSSRLSNSVERQDVEDTFRLLPKMPNRFCLVVETLLLFEPASGSSSERSLLNDLLKILNIL